MKIRTALRSFAFLASFALVLAGLGVQPVMGRSTDPTPPPAGPAVGLTGTLEVAHFDDFVRGHTHLYWLKTASARIPLTFTDDSGQWYGGDPVHVTGRQVGDTVNVEDLKVLPLGAAGTGSVTGPTAAATAASTSKNIAVILLNFSNDTSQPFTPAAAYATMFTNTGSVKGFFEEESRGAVTVTGQVFGWYTIPSANTGCDTTNAWSTWGSQAQTAAQNAGVNLSSFTNIVFAWPGASSCGWAGLAYVPGTLTYNNGSFGLRVIAHELSHNFGIMHASSLNCTSGSARVSFSSTCTYSEYGDPFTVMGAGSTFHNAGLQIGQMGWLDPAEVQTIVPTATAQTYQVGPLLTSSGVKDLKVARGDGSFFYIDYRAIVGTTYDKFAVGSPPVTGVTIRLSSDQAMPGGSTHNTMLIDTTPATTSYSDAPLLVGQTFTDPVKGVSITTVSAGATATVSITSNSSTTAPGAPNLTAATAANGSVALAWSAPTSNGGSSITGYAVYRGASAGAETLYASPGNVTSWTDTGVTNGQIYFYKVAATNAIGTGTLSNELSATPTGPSRPGAPSLTGATAGVASVALTWNAPAASGGAAISGYNVYRGTSANGETLLTTLGNVTSWTSTGLTNGTTYFYKVTALNSVGEGAQSNERSATPSSGATAPAAPALTGATPGNAVVALTWTAPSNGGSAITGYSVYRGTTAGSETFLTTLGTVTSWNSTGLTNGQTYFFKVTAFNAIGESVTSNELSATPNGPQSPPSTIKFVKTIGAGTTSRAGNAALGITVPAAGVATGNWIIIAASVGTFGGAVGCSDTKGNTYTIDADVSAVGRQFVCSARVANALTSSDKIVVTYPGFSGVTTAIASEFSGISAVDQHNSGDGNSTAPTSGTVSTGTAKELLFGAVSHNGTSTLAMGCGFGFAGKVVTGTGGGTKTIDVGYQVTSATGTFSACGTLTPTGTWWQAAIATYR